MSTVVDTPTEPTANASGSPRPPASASWFTRATWLTAPLFATVLGLAAWQVASVASGGWVPGLVDIWNALISVLGSDTLMSDVGITLRRVLTVWIATVLVGVVVGVAAGFSWRLRAFLRPILAVAMAIPDLVYIIMVVLVLGVAESSGLAALVLAISPLVINVVMNAVLERDRRLDEMAATYRLRGWSYFRNVLWWQLRPAVQAGMRTAFAFSWKLMVLMEGITTATGVGAQILYEFKFLRPAEMIAWALIFTALMKAIEVLLVQRLLRDRTQPRESV